MIELELVWGPVLLKYQSKAPDEIDWVRAHTVGAGVGALPLECSVSLSSVISKELYEDLVAGLDLRNARRVSSFRDEEYAYVAGASVEAWVMANRPANPVAVFRDRREWKVVSQPSEHSERNGLRVAREIVRRHLLDRGNIPLHASAAGGRSGGIVFAGESGSGKTTLALTYAGHGTFVSGDRVSLGESGGRLVAVGVPASERIGFGTLESRGLVGPLEGRGVRRHQAAVNGDGTIDPRARTSSSLKIELSRREITELFQISTADATPVDLVVIVRRGGPPSVRRVTSEEAIALLRPHMLIPDPVWGDHWLRSPAARATPLADPSSIAGRTTAVIATWEPHANQPDQLLGQLARYVAG